MKKGPASASSEARFREIVHVLVNGQALQKLHVRDREYREKVLSELARRRELAREQIEHLIHDRDRLVAAFDRARLAANDVVGDLTEFDELSEEVARLRLYTWHLGPRHELNQSTKI